MFAIIFVWDKEKQEKTKIRYQNRQIVSKFLFNANELDEYKKL